MPKAPGQFRRAGRKENTTKCNSCTGSLSRTQCQHTSRGQELVPTSGSTAAEKAVSSKSRTARKCYSCEGLPAKSECAHGKMSKTPLAYGVAKGKKNDVYGDGDRFPLDASSVEAYDAAEAFNSTPCLSRESSSDEEEHSSLSPGGQNPENPPLELAPTSDSPSAEGQSVHAPLESLSAPRNHKSLTLLNNSTTSTSDQNAEFRVSTPEPDPSLLRQMKGFTSTHAFYGSTTPLTSPSDSSTSSSPIRPIKVFDSPRATQTNPIYGHVSGAKRGNEPFNVVRTRKLGKSIDDRTDKSRRFLRLIHNLLQKCEDLAHETDAWVFLSAQHPCASGSPISFASSKLRLEAPDVAGRMATDFSKTTARLLLSKRTNAAELQRKLEEANERKEKAEASVQLQQTLLNLYEQRFGTIDGRSGTI